MGVSLHAQQSDKKNSTSFFIIPELAVGKTMEANTGFPKTDLQKSLFVSIGRYNSSNDQRWAAALGYPKTGLSLGITDFGNTDKLGLAYSVLPFVEFGLFKKRSDRWNVNVGMGAAYLDTQYDPETNPFNLAVTTKVNWTFRSFLYYDFLKRRNINWRLGIGYAHFSNGHTRLPNQGLNSFLINISSEIGKQPSVSQKKNGIPVPKKKRYSENYFSFRAGIGQNVLSRIFNDKKEVYSVALSGGKIINKTYKFGIGAYYRFYEHYYDHIREDGELIGEQVPEYKEHPFRYATNFGFFGSAELFLGHVGILFDLGINIYKPFYKIEWQLSQGFFYQGQYARLGELNSYYRIKRTITGRMGIRYYLFNTSKSPKNNVFLGATINSNLGQADFSELSLGYAYRFGFKEKSK